MEKIRTGAVSYLNTKPLIHGLQHGMMKDEVELIIDYPSRIASMLINDEIDLGLVPVVIIPELKQHYIISDYCIGCDGEVGSVCLFSDVPLNQIEKILLDYQSNSSVELLKILIKEYWRIDVDIEHSTKNYRDNIKGTTAGLVIGDRSFEQRKISEYAYDLGLEWKKFASLPFVFAAWISNKKLNDSFIKSFNESSKIGLQNIDEVVRENPYDLFDLKKYYTSYINYQFNSEMKEGMFFFLEKLCRISYDKMIV